MVRFAIIDARTIDKIAMGVGVRGGAARHTRGATGENEAVGIELSARAAACGDPERLPSRCWRHVGAGAEGGGNVRADPTLALRSPPPAFTAAVFGPRRLLARQASCPAPGADEHSACACRAGSPAGREIGVIDSGVNSQHRRWEGQGDPQPGYISSPPNNLRSTTWSATARRCRRSWPGKLRAMAGRHRAGGVDRLGADHLRQAPNDDGSGQGNEVSGALGLKPIHQDLIDRGARIMNNSWGGLYWTNPDATPAIADEYRPFIFGNDGLVVFATGNSRFANPSDTARCRASRAQRHDAGGRPGARLAGGGRAGHRQPDALASYSNACGIAMRYCLVPRAKSSATGTNDTPSHRLLELDWHVVAAPRCRVQPRWCGRRSRSSTTTRCGRRCWPRRATWAPPASMRPSAGACSMPGRADPGPGEIRLGRACQGAVSNGIAGFHLGRMTSAVRAASSRTARAGWSSTARTLHRPDPGVGAVNSSVRSAKKITSAVNIGAAGTLAGYAPLGSVGTTAAPCAWDQVVPGSSRRTTPARRRPVGADAGAAQLYVEGCGQHRGRSRARAWHQPGWSCTPGLTVFMSANRRARWGPILQRDLGKQNVFLECQGRLQRNARMAGHQPTGRHRGGPGDGPEPGIGGAVPNASKGAFRNDRIARHGGGRAPGLATDSSMRRRTLSRAHAERRPRRNDRSPASPANCMPPTPRSR